MFFFHMCSLEKEESGERHQTPLKKRSIMKLVASGGTASTILQHIFNGSDLLVHSANITHEDMSLCNNP